MLKVYLAASYSQRARMNDVIAPALRRIGYEVVSTWIDGHHEVPGREVDNGEGFNADEEEIRGWASEDILDLMHTDVVIQFTDWLASHRGGAHVEFGFGLGAGKICVIIGPKINVFHYLNGPGGYQYDTWEEALPALERLVHAVVL